MLTAFLPLAAFLAAPPASPPPERVVAVHEIPGAVVFDLDRAGALFQLTISLDDDGAVVATAIDRVGPADLDGGVALGAAGFLDTIDRIDVATDGAAVIVRSGATSARFSLAAAD